MATKTSILAYILERWGDITSPKRVPLLDREVSQIIVNEIYPTVITETEETTQVLTASGGDIEYTFKIWKQGRTVNIEGFFRNTSFLTLSSPDLASITNTDYESSAFATYLDCFNSSGQKIQLEIVATEIRVNGSLNLSRFYVNSKFPTLN
jgi:hypothetical protein